MLFCCVSFHCPECIMNLVIIMPQKKTEDAKPKKERRPVDLDLDLVPKIAMIAGALGMSVPAYVNARMQTVVEEEMPRVIAQMSRKDK